MRMLRGVSFRGAVRLGFVALSVLATVALLAGGVLAAKQWLDTVVFNQRYYTSLKASQVDSFETLVERFEEDQLRWAPLLPPCEKPLVLSEQIVAVDFDSGAFSKEALAQFVPAERLGVTVYPVLVIEDPLTRARVVTCGQSEIARIPAPPDYDPLWPLAALCGDAARAAAWREQSPWMTALFDSSRIVGRYALLPAEDLSHFVALISATSSRKSVLKEGEQRKALRTAVEQLTIAGLEHAGTGMTLTIAYPDDFTNGLDIFGTDDLIAYWWDLLGTAAVSTSATSIAWTDTDATNVASRYYRVGVGGIDGDEDGFADAREELMYHSDPENSASYPVTVSGSVTHSNTPQTGPIYIVAVKASNSWDTGRSDVIASPGAFAVEGVPNLADYWVKAWRDWCPNGTPDPWEATGTATNCPLWLSGSVSNLAIVLCDPTQSINGTLSYTGRQAGVVHAVTVLASNSMALTYSDALSSPGAYSIADLPQTTYWARAWIDADADGLFDADREASGAWTNNPFLLSNSVWDIDFSLTDVDADADGMPDWWELTHFGGTNQTSSGDYDADQMPNGWEYAWGFCPTNAADAMDDRDGDGYPNVYECKHASNPHKAVNGLPGEDDALPAPTITVTTNGAYTLQVALDAATSAYDIVLVSAGTYVLTNDLDFGTNVVLLISADGPGATIIDADGCDRVVDFPLAIGSHASLNGFTLINGVKGDGAGIRCDEGANPTIVNCIVSNCAATGDGGGLFCDGASPTVRDCIFTGNSAGDDGGGVRCKDNSSPTFTNCLIDGNSAASHGGGMHWTGSTGTVTDCEIGNNASVKDGGGVYCEGSAPSFTSCIISGNLAQDDGGGVRCTNAPITLTSCVLTGNTAHDHGGGFYANTSAASLDRCTISENTAVDGGGIGCNGSTMSILSCQIVDNWAHVDGGGIRAKDCSPTVRNCLIARNRAFGYGGGVDVKGYAASVVLESCTVADNRSRLEGGGLAATEWATAGATNSVLWGNNPDQIYHPYETAALSHCCIQGGASGTGIVTNDPVLTTSSFHLQTGSSCTNAGTNAAWMASALDIDDEGRITNAVVDIGCDELYDRDGDGMSDAWETDYFGGLSRNGDGDYDGDGLSDADEYASDGDPTDTDTDGDGFTDGSEAAAGMAVAAADDPDKLTLTYRFGDALGGSHSERYILTIVNTTNSDDKVCVTNPVFGAELTGEYGFTKGAVYDVSLDHYLSDTNWEYIPDFDYQAYIDDLGGPTGWVFGAGFVLCDTNGILGNHWEDLQTTVFDASNKTAQLYVLLTDIGVDTDGDGCMTVTDEVAEAVSPGGLVGVNWDDDNTNGVADWLGTGMDTNEDDLVRMPLHVGPTNLDVGQIVLEIRSGTNLVNVWDNPWKGAATNCLVGPAADTNLCVWTVGPTGTLATLGDFAYTNFWIEGLTNGVTNCDVEIVFRYEDTNGVCRSADTNVLTVVRVEVLSDCSSVVGSAYDIAFTISSDSWTNIVWSIVDTNGGHGPVIVATNDVTNLLVSVDTATVGVYRIQAAVSGATQIVGRAELTVLYTETDPEAQAGVDSTVDPISTISSANRFSESDIAIGCPGIPLVMRRTYNSRWDEHTRNLNVGQRASYAPMGLNWTHSLDWFLEDRGHCVYRGATGDCWRVLHTGDTGLHWFRETSPGSYADTVDEGYQLSGNTVALRGGVSATFNGDGFVDSISDTDGNSLTFAYGYGPLGGSNLYDKVLTSVSGSCGHVLTFSYTSVSNDVRQMNLISKVATDDAAFYVEYFYTTNGMLTNVLQHTSVATYSSTYAYDGATGPLCSRTTRAGHTAGFGHGIETNAVGQVFAQTTNMTGMSGFWPHTVGFGDGTSVVSTDAPPSVASTTVVYPGTPGQTATYGFDACRRRVLHLSAGSATNSLTYDGAGRADISAEVLSESATARIDRTFDSGHRVAQAGFGYNAVGPKSTFAWGGDDVLDSIEDPDTVTTSFSYSGLKVSGVGLADGRTVAFDYIDGLLSSVTPSWAPVVSYSRNSLHHVTNVTVGCRSYGMGVDELGRVWSVSYPDGGSESFSYGASSAPVSQTDRGGRTTAYAYEPGGHLSQVTRGGVDVLTIDYEAQMQALSITDALGRNVEGYVLDCQYRPTTVTNVEGQTMSIGYTVGSFADSISRFDGTSVTFGYDIGGRVTSVAYPDQTITYGYTSAGRLTSASNALGTVGISYSAAGQPTSFSGVGPAGWTSASYTMGGLAAGYTNAAGVWTNSYSGYLLVSQAGPQGAFTFGHDGCDQVTTVDCPGGVVLSNAYDSLGRIVEMLWTGAGGTTLRRFNLAYDDCDRISSITNETGGCVIYAYDGTFDWLLSETVYDSTGGVARADSYGYDLVGNRLTNVVAGATNTYTLGSGNRLSALGYNAAGCVTNLGGMALSWNGSYQLTGVSTGTLAKTYQYDALGRLVSTSDGTTTNWLVYVGPHVSAETDDSGNVLRSYTHAPGIDWPLAMNVYTGGVTNTYIFLTDHLGTVHALVAAATSNVVESYTFDAWGNILGVRDGSGSPVSTTQFGNPYLFHGRRYDWDTGLYNFRARWYDPVTGRWLSNDPIGISGGLNQYVFCANNPVNLTDPYGLFQLGVFVRGVAGATVSGIGMAVGGAAAATGVGTAPGVALALYSSYGFGANVGNIVNSFRDAGSSPTGPIGTATVLATDSRTARNIAEAADLAIPLALSFGAVPQWGRLPTAPYGAPGALAGTLQRVPGDPSVIYPWLRGFQYGDAALWDYDAWRWTWSPDGADSCK